MHLRSDVERKRLAGIPEHASSGSGVQSGLYTLDMSARVYGVLAQGAADALAGGALGVTEAGVTLGRLSKKFQRVDGLALQQPAKGWVGIVTDRDVLRGQLDRQSDMFCLTVGDVMTRRPLVLLEDCDAATAVDRMSAQVVRRAPVVDQEGHLVGIVSFDDLLSTVATQISALAKLIGTQAGREPKRRR